MKIWQCSVCKYIHRGDKPPAKCPICNVGPNKFKEIDEASIPDRIPRRRQPIKRTEQDIKVNETSAGKITSLLIKHHAHPVAVHTPNGLLPFAVILWMLAWIFDSQLLAKAAFINQIFVIVSLPFVIFSGIIEWQKKYNTAFTMLFKMKILAAAVTTLTCFISTLWFFIDPDILLSSNSWGFMFNNIIMLTAAGIAGHIGGKLVFKD